MKKNIKIIIEIKIVINIMKIPMNIILTIRIKKAFEHYILVNCNIFIYDDICKTNHKFIELDFILYTSNPLPNNCYKFKQYIMKYYLKNVKMNMKLV